MSIRLITFGGLRGSRNDEELDGLGSQLIRAALLTYLSVVREAKADALKDLLWGEAGDKSLDQRLKQHVLELRKALDQDCIIRNGRSLKAGQHLTADANDFEKAVAEGRHADAMALYRGEFLAGVHLVSTNQFDTWVDARRAGYARKFRQACRAVVEARYSSGDHSGALAAAEAWVEGDSQEDEARHRLIELHILAGNRSEALNHFETHKRMLEREGLEPLEQTKQLIAQLRAAKGPGVAQASVQKPLPTQQPLSTLAPLSAGGPTRLGADVDPRLEPTALTNLEVIRQIGAGAGARVYLARDVALQRLVALKVLLPELANDATARARFDREARAAAKLLHPNIVTIHQVAQLSDGTPFLVTEYVEGRNLADTLQAEGTLSEAEACGVVRQIAAALEAAHARGYIHRDVRPANIMWIRETGRAVLMDFGIVAAVESGAQGGTPLTDKGEVLGDPVFASPEQLLSSNVTMASDIYSLGVTAYVMLTGGGPHPSAKGARAIHARLDQPAESLTKLRPGINLDFAELLLRCLSIKPEHRPSAREVGRALDRIRAS